MCIRDSSGDGEIIEPDDDLAAIGSGGPYALAAAKALLQNTDLDAAEVARRSLVIAASLCIYTCLLYTSRCV